MSQYKPRSDRLTSLVALLVHLLAVGGAPVADASFGYSPADTHPHIEAQSDGPCFPAHNDLDCQICSVLGRDQIGSSRVLPAIGGSCVTFLSSPSAAPWHRSPKLAARLGARAPPLV